MSSNNSLQSLEQKLGYQFQNDELLAAALTHSSTGAADNYERLEFLGDRVLGLVMAEILYRRFPHESEGDMAKRHAALVNGKTLAAIAQSLDLGAALILSHGERAAGSAENTNILADSFEALIGALYLDAGLERTALFLETWWGSRIETMTKPPQDPKTALQEWAQARGLDLPAYRLSGREGPDHAPLFTIEVKVDGFDPVSASGPSRRRAEKEAARKLLDILQDDQP